MSATQKQQKVLFELITEEKWAAHPESHSDLIRLVRYVSEATIWLNFDIGTYRVNGDNIPLETEQLLISAFERTY